MQPEKPQGEKMAVKYLDVEYSTDSAFNQMIEHRNRALHGKTSSKTEVKPKIVSDATCPAVIDDDLSTFLGRTINYAATSDSLVRLNKFISVQNAGVALGKALLNKQKLEPNCYQQVLEKTQDYAEILLDAELKLGQELQNIPTKPGKRTDLQPNNTNVAKSKKEVLEELGITDRVACDLQKLTAEAVDEAKKKARANREIVTRKMALEKVQKKHFEQNNIKTPFVGEFDKNDRPSVDTFEDKQPLYYTQLFASVGVGEEKLEQIGLYPSVANESEHERYDWYKKRHPNCKVIEGKFDEPKIFEQVVAAHLKRKNKLILASPVCRDFSVAGKRDFDNPRAKLIFKVLELIRRTDKVTKHVLIENVPGFLTAAPENWPELQRGNGRINLGTYVKEELEKLGYTVNIGVVYGADYNTAQKRRRAFILASKDGLWKFPKKDVLWKTLMDTIGHLHPLEPGEQSTCYPLHRVPDIDPAQAEVLRHTPTGSSAQDNEEEFRPVTKGGAKSKAKFNSHNKRNSWGMPSATIMQHNGNIGSHQTVHPGRPTSDGTWTDPRPFSILELLLITGLDENYFIPAGVSDDLIRNVLGDCLLPNVNLALCSMLPGRK